MSKLMQRMRAKPGERGAVAVLFAILLASGVMLSLVGLVVDAGRAYVYQKQVQRSADEAAQALGMLCAKTAKNSNCLSSTVTTTSPLGTQTETVGNFLYGVANPSGQVDGFEITRMCGYSVRNLGLPACPALTGNRTDCKTAMTTSYEWVRVYVSAPIMQKTFGLFENNTGSFQEKACGQSYYGKAGSIIMDPTTSPLPIAMGICSLTKDSVATQMIVGESSAASCGTVVDRNGLTFAAAKVGWVVINTASSPTTNAYCWTISTTNACVPVALSTKTNTVSNYTTFLNLIKANVNKSNLIPIVDKKSNSLYVVGYAAFRLKGIKFPTISGISAATTTVTPTGYSWPANGDCSGTATQSSKFCIVGVFENRVSSPYGNNRAVTITSDPSVPDFGFTIIKHAY